MFKLLTLTVLLIFFSLNGCSNSNSHMEDGLTGIGAGAQPNATASPTPRPTTDPDQPDATPTPTPTKTPTNTPTPIFTFTPIPTFTPTATSMPTFTFTPTPTKTPTPTATFTFTPVPTFTNTPTPTPSPTFTLTPSPTFSFTPTATSTYTPTPIPLTPTPTPVPTLTATPTYTYSPTPSPSSTPTPIPVDCDFDSYKEVVPKACLGQTMTVACEIVAEVKKYNSKVKILATRKNAGSWSRNYDAKAVFPSFRSVLLPKTISVIRGGDAGTGKKLYLYFDNGVTCSYRSNGNNKYITPTCKLFGLTDPSKTDGFTAGVGTYVSDERVEDILSVHAQVNGSGGNGVVTTVQFDLMFD